MSLNPDVGEDGRLQNVRIMRTDGESGVDRVVKDEGDGVTWLQVFAGITDVHRELIAVPLDSNSGRSIYR